MKGSLPKGKRSAMLRGRRSPSLGLMRLLDVAKGRSGGSGQPGLPNGAARFAVEQERTLGDFAGFWGGGKEGGLEGQGGSFK